MFENILGLSLKIKPLLSCYNQLIKVTNPSIQLQELSPADGPHLESDGEVENYQDGKWNDEGHEGGVDAETSWLLVIGRPAGSQVVSEGSRVVPVTEPGTLNIHGKGHYQSKQPGGEDGDVGGAGGDGVVGVGSEHGQEPVHTDPDHVVDGDGAEGNVKGNDQLAE